MSVLAIWITPPEEDGPPFCCFDAADPLDRCTPSEEDLEGPGSALDLISRQFSSSDGAPVFHRAAGSIVLPRRSGGRSIENVLFNADQDPDITIRGSSNTEDDSEIIEVIKVRRHVQSERDVQPPVPASSVSEPALKSSKSFISRASKAFKNVRRSVSRTKIPPLPPPAEVDDFPSDPESSRTPSPIPSRRSSTMFSSLFSHSPSLHSRSSLESLGDPIPSSPVRETSSNPLSIMMHEPPSSVEMHGFVPYPDTDDEDDRPDLDELQNTPRASSRSSIRSPSPTQFSRRRFSVLNLFSASKESMIQGSSDTGPSFPIVLSPSTPTLPNGHKALSGPSRTDSTESSSSSGPTTPVDEAFPCPAVINRPPSSLLKRLPSFSRAPKWPKADSTANTVVVAPSPAAEGVHEDDLSFGEMRLDSLHFDDISFDATRF